MLEDRLQRSVIQLAQLLGWKIYHARPARVKCQGGRGRRGRCFGSACKACRGTGWSWRTAGEGDVAGWPDCVMVNAEIPARVVVAELKSAAGKVTPEQVAWLKVWKHAGVEVYVWRPAHWTSGEIERCLRRKGRV